MKLGNAVGPFRNASFRGLDLKVKSYRNHHCYACIDRDFLVVESIATDNVHFGLGGEAEEEGCDFSFFPKIFFSTSGPNSLKIVPVTLRAVRIGVLET